MAFSSMGLSACTDKCIHLLVFDVIETEENTGIESNTGLVMPQLISSKNGTEYWNVSLKIEIFAEDGSIKTMLSS